MFLMNNGRIGKHTENEVFSSETIATVDATNSITICYRHFYWLTSLIGFKSLEIHQMEWPTEKIFNGNFDYTLFILRNIMKRKKTREQIQ